MRALRQESFGAPEVLKVVNVPDPVPLPSEVVVRVEAIGLNPVEAFVRAGYFPLIGQPPLATVSEDKADFVRSLGAHELIDYRRTRFEEVAREVDIVVECIGGETATRSIATLRPGGLFVTLVGRSDRGLQSRVEQAGRRFIGITVEPDQVGLEHLAQWVEAGRLRVHVDEVFDFEDAARAHARLDAGSIRGKLVLAMSKR